MTGDRKRGLATWVILLAFCLSLGAAGARAQAEETAGRPEPVFSGEKISLEVQNADLHDVLRTIGEVSGKNVVVSEGVRGKVTLKLTDMPWDQALDTVLASRNLVLEESEKVLIIYDQATFQKIRAARQSLD